MSEPTALSAEIGDELRRYFAVTTSRELPKSVREMSVRTLTTRRRHQRTLMAPATAGLAGVAAVLALAIGIGSHGLSASPSLSAGSGAAPFAPAAGISATGGGGTHSGGDRTRLGQSGVRLLSPVGHGTAMLSPARAQADAAAAVAVRVGAPGPAVLAFVIESGRPRPASCLCWVVAVPVAQSASRSQPAVPPVVDEVVLVDADSGRVFATLPATGTP